MAWESGHRSHVWQPHPRSTTGHWHDESTRFLLLDVLIETLPYCQGQYRHAITCVRQIMVHESICSGAVALAEVMRPMS